MKTYCADHYAGHFFLLNLYYDITIFSPHSLVAYGTIGSQDRWCFFMIDNNIFNYAAGVPF